MENKTKGEEATMDFLVVSLSAIKQSLQYLEENDLRPRIPHPTKTVLKDKIKIFQPFVVFISISRRSKRKRRMRWNSWLRTK